jgi:hypothetical protein
VVHYRLAQQPCRVDPKAGLGVGEAVAGHQPDAEIRAAIGAVAQRRHFLAQVQARADHDRLGLLAVRGEQRGDVLRPVLTVAVERDHRARAERERALHAVPQARAFSEVHRMAQQLERQALERRRGAVGGSVVDHDQRADLRQRTLGHVTDRGRLVVGRDDGDAIRAHAIAPLTEMIWPDR